MKTHSISTWQPLCVLLCGFPPPPDSHGQRPLFPWPWHPGPILRLSNFTTPAQWTQQSILNPSSTRLLSSSFQTVNVLQLLQLSLYLSLTLFSTESLQFTAQCQFSCFPFCHIPFQSAFLLSKSNFSRFSLLLFSSFLSLFPSSPPNLPLPPLKSRPWSRPASPSFLIASRAASSPTHHHTPPNLTHPPPSQYQCKPEHSLFIFNDTLAVSLHIYLRNHASHNKAVPHAKGVNKIVHSTWYLMIMNEFPPGWSVKRAANIGRCGCRWRNSIFIPYN